MEENKIKISELGTDTLVYEMNKIIKAIDNLTMKLKETRTDDIACIGKISAKLRRLQVRYNMYATELKRRKKPVRKRGK